MAGSGLGGLVPDWLIALFGLLGLGSGGGAVGYVRKVKRTAEEAEALAEKNRRTLEGTDDPNHEGINKIVHETRSELRQFRKETRAEHQQVMDRLDDLEGDD